MKSKILAGVLIGLTACTLLCSTARADSITDYIHFRAGVGGSEIQDLGDGTWTQQGARSNHEEKNTIALMAGFTGELYQCGSFDLSYHADYVYLGTYTASVDGVPDNQYNAQSHTIVGYQGERFSPFNGQGHTQGVPLTLDLGYTWHGYRIGVEAGEWAYWQAWHESLYTLGNQWEHMERPSKVQFGYVVGASIAKGPLALSYRYYQIKPDWSTGTPGLARGASVLMATYRF